MDYTFPRRWRRTIDNLLGGKRMNYKTLLKLDYGYTENQLFDVIEKYKWLFKLNYTIDELFAVEYKRLQMEDEKHGI